MMISMIARVSWAMGGGLLHALICDLRCNVQWSGGVVNAFEGGELFSAGEKFP